MHRRKNGERLLRVAVDSDAPLPKYASTESRGTCGGYRYTERTGWVMVRFVSCGGVAQHHVGELMQIVLVGYSVCELTRCAI